MYLTKHHGLGNDFLVTFVDEVPERAPELATDLCHRNTGVGADGLIFGTDGCSPPLMRLFNADGSPAEISGNGLRCFLQALAMRREVTSLEIDVDTAAGIRSCLLEPTDQPNTVLASTDMGPVTAGDQPDVDDFLDDVSAFVAVDRWAIGSVGNPHVVLEVADPQSVDLAAVGPRISSHFPHGVNAHLVSVIGTDALFLKPWERGAGLTTACGSGASVAAQRLHEWGVVGDHVTVEMPGGRATVDVANGKRNTVVLSGPATFIAAVQVPGV